MTLGITSQHFCFSVNLKSQKLLQEITECLIIRISCRKIARASFDKFPTLCIWHIQYNARYILFDSKCPTNANVLSSFVRGQTTGCSSTLLYFSIPFMYFFNSPLFIQLYLPDVVIHNTAVNSNLLLELTCPLNLKPHFQAVGSLKQNKEEYYQLLIELYRL